MLIDLTLSHKQIQTCQRVHVWVRVYTSWSALNLFKLALILELRVIWCYWLCKHRCTESQHLTQSRSGW